MILVNLLVIFILISGGNPQNCDQDWKEYEEKCIYIIDISVSKEEATNLCERRNASLINIKDLKEQDFINNALYSEILSSKNKCHFDNFWLGISRVDNSEKFTWEENEYNQFTNWNSNQPSSGPENKCVKMVKAKSSDENETTCKMNVTSCDDQNYVICEKLKSIPLHEIQKRLFKLTIENNILKENAIYYNQEIDQLKKDNKYLSNSLESSNKEIDNLNSALSRVNGQVSFIRQDINRINRDVNNSIPIGYIYFQTANEDPPTRIWPQYTWRDVSGDYSGLFFRVTGGNSGRIGSIQEGSAPRISRMEFTTTNHNKDRFTTDAEDIPREGWSERVKTGVYYNGYNSNYVTEWIRLQSTGGEVRPRNTAMRVWRRTA